MKRLLPLVQFLPVSIFLAVARSRGLTGEAWSLAFQIGALAAILETVILLPLLRNKMSRLIMGANFFLVAGGFGFFFNFAVLTQLLGTLREAGIFFFVGIVCIVSVFVTPTGVFEETDLGTTPDKRLSLYFIGGVCAAFAWAFANRGNPTLGGLVPFVSIIFLKRYLARPRSSAMS